MVSRKQDGEDLFGFDSETPTGPLDRGSIDASGTKHNFTVVESGQHPDRLYTPQCSCGQCDTNTTSTQRDAWEAVWDHAVPGWRAMPVWHAKDSGYEDSVRFDRFVKLTYPSDWKGPLLRIDSDCSQGQEVDKKDGIATRHSSAYVFTINGRQQVCVCNCHGAEKELPQRCQSTCEEIATVPAFGHHFELPEIRQNRPATRCEPHYLAWRNRITMLIEVGNRWFYEPFVGWDGVREHDRYATDPDFVHERAVEQAEAKGQPIPHEPNYRFSTFGVGNNVHLGRRDPAHHLDLWESLHNPALPIRAHSLDTIWTLYMDSLKAAGQDVDVPYVAPEWYQQMFRRTPAEPGPVVSADEPTFDFDDSGSLA